jgi:hypothetical protein
LECNEDTHADNGSDEKHCNHDVHRGYLPETVLSCASGTDYFEAGSPHMTQIALDRARIDALIGQLVAAGVAQHVRVDFHIEAGDLSRACASVSLVSWQREADKADIKTAPEECVKFNPAGIISRIS